MENHKRILVKLAGVTLAGIFMLFGAGCIVVPSGYGHHGHRGYHGHHDHHDDDDRDNGYRIRKY